MTTTPSHRKQNAKLIAPPDSTNSQQQRPLAPHDHSFLYTDMNIHAMGIMLFKLLFTRSCFLSYYLAGILPPTTLLSRRHLCIFHVFCILIMARTKDYLRKTTQKAVIAPPQESGHCTATRQHRQRQIARHGTAMKMQAFYMKHILQNTSKQRTEKHHRYLVSQLKST